MKINSMSYRPECTTCGGWVGVMGGAGCSCVRPTFK
ncbi:membrane lipoprotein [Vibrio phage 1.031.O._10N.261.46.F8]|nr:membrane lipoprotein [Vibrio phage 1.031.O._10N.261.46.F8]